MAYLDEKDRKQVLDFDVAGRSLRIHHVPVELLYSQKTYASQLFPMGMGERGAFGLNGRKLSALADHLVLSIDIEKDDRWLAVGTDSAIFRLDRTGRVLWQVPVAAPAIGVLASLDGTRLAAAHLDGSVRWYDTNDGQELLALFIASHGTPEDPAPWVLWTPVGYYDRSSAAEQLVAFHYNRGPNHAAELIPVSQVASMPRRPDIISRALSRTSGPELFPIVSAIAVPDSPIRRPSSPISPANSASNQAERDLHVLSIGVTKYRMPEYSKLTFPAIDAQSVAERLDQQHGGMYAKVKSTLLLDEKATFAEIRQALQGLSSGSRQEDVTVIYFAGHAERHPNGDEYMLLPYDYQEGKEANTALLGSELGSFVTKIHGIKIIILDTCHAGGVLNGIAYRSPESPRHERLVAELAKASPGTIVLAASADDQLASESQELGHGILTGALLEALRGCPIVPPQADSKMQLSMISSQGAVRLGMLKTYLGLRVKELTNGVQTFHGAESRSFDLTLPLAAIDQPCSSPRPTALLPASLAQ